MANLELAFLFSLLVSTISIPIFKSQANKFKILDEPSEDRLSSHSIPLLGGVGVFLGFSLTFLIFGEFNSNIFFILLGSFAMLVFGLIDDRYNLNSRAKFVFPFMFVILVVLSGIRTQFLGNFYLDCFFSFMWIFGLVNSFNFLDNMDGICGGVSAICTFNFGIIALITDQINIAILSFALSGSCIGFLFYNFNPAKIYLGDGGSLFLGFVISCIGIEGTWSGGGSGLDQVTSMSLIPIFILAYPIFDTTCVVFWRLTNGRPPWIGDINHTTHKFLRLGLNTKNVSIVVYIITAGFGFGAFLINEMEPINRIYFSLIMLSFLIPFFMLLNRVKFIKNKL